MPNTAWMKEIMSDVRYPNAHSTAITMMLCKQPILLWISGKTPSFEGKSSESVLGWDNLLTHYAAQVAERHLELMSNDWMPSRIIDNRPSIGEAPITHMAWQGKVAAHRLVEAWRLTIEKDVASVLKTYFLWDFQDRQWSGRFGEKYIAWWRTRQRQRLVSKCTQRLSGLREDILS